jgi:hypothetical protein
MTSLPFALLAMTKITALIIIVAHGRQADYRQIIMPSSTIHQATMYYALGIDQLVQLSFVGVVDEW